MKNRNYGIDLLKIISMLMVITLHVFGTGGCLAASAKIKSRYCIFYLLETYSYAAVDIFAIITGYLSVEKAELKIRKIIKRWAQIEFYSLFGTAICIVIGLATFEQVNIKTILFPITYGQWGYATSYIILLFFEPFINTMLQNLSRANRQNLFVIIIVLGTIWTTISKSDPMKLASGYAPLWIALVYVLGGIIKLSNDELRQIKTRTLIRLSILAPLVAYALKIGFDVWGTEWSIANSSILIAYTSPCILIFAITIMILFSRLTVSRFNRIVLWGSKVSFGVFLGHTQITFRENFWTSRFTWISGMQSNVIAVLMVIIITAVVFILFGIIESMRIWIFGLIKKEK